MGHASLMGRLPVEALNKASWRQRGICVTEQQMSPSFIYFARTETVPADQKPMLCFSRLWFSRTNIHLIKRNVQYFSPLFRYVFFLDPCNIDFINRKINSIALCVSKCPADELKTYSDLKQFALNNGEGNKQATQ